MDNLVRYTARESHLLKLPVETFTTIFEYVVESYVLKADIVVPQIRDATPGRLLFSRPRTWANMNIFQICQAFRCLAIACYGVPRRDALPFNPDLDTLSFSSQVVRHNTTNSTFTPYPFGFLTAHWLSDLQLSIDGVYSRQIPLTPNIRIWRPRWVQTSYANLEASR